MNDLLDEAIILAASAHKGQLDKAGQPYILHPLRVMHQMQSPIEQIVAVLHDVLEDTDISTAKLQSAGFPCEIICALKHLTKTDDESYSEFIFRISLNPLAVKVKIADIQDNLNILRLDHLSDQDLERIKKYHKAIKELTQHAASTI